MIEKNKQYMQNKWERGQQKQSAVSELYNEKIFSPEMQRKVKHEKSLDCNYVRAQE